MFSGKKNLWGLVLTSLLFTFQVSAFSGDDEDDYYDQASPVARIRYLEGEAQIKRLDSEEWETAVQNLPLVEGDEVLTGPDTRLELQFDTNTYLRLDENSNLRILSFGNEGVAVSISTGSLVLTVLKFDDESGYFEIDAPKTTLAVAGEGRYRVDAGDEFDRQVKVSLTDGGRARLYSLDSGFTLVSDQSAVMPLEGSYAGQWEVSRSVGINDDFDDWVAKRDEYVNDSLRNAHYDRYYDQDIYGADDLNDYGNWQYNSSYGYIWRPYSSSISRYANWSPYRYGHWRWVPFYGWTWVNDEPWGWATYHYGRWVWVNGYWAWAPYSYPRYRRSWWRPAIVYIGYVGNRICWYPLPYGYSYYDYNRRYRNRWRQYRRDRRNDRRNDRRDTPPTDDRRRTPSPANVARANRNQTPPFGRIPRGGVITAPAGTFGTKAKGFDTAPREVSDEILKKVPVVADSPPILPDRKDIGGTMSPDILIVDRKPFESRKDVKTGADDRTTGEPLDERLKRQKIYGNRPPLTTVPRTSPPADQDRPRTGAVERRRDSRQPTDGKRADEPTTSTFPRIDRTPPVNPVERKRPPETKADRSPPIYVPPGRTNPVERKTDPPRYDPPPRRMDPPKRTEQPRQSPPTRRPDPPKRYDPPKRQDPPRQSPPTRRPDPPKRYDPPKRQDPPRQSPPTRKPDPPKSNPKSGGKSPPFSKPDSDN